MPYTLGTCGTPFRRRCQARRHTPSAGASTGAVGPSGCPPVEGDGAAAGTGRPNSTDPRSWPLSDAATCRKSSGRS